MLFAVVIGSLMIPIQVTIVPLFLVMSKIGLTNSLWALIFPGIFSAFGIFLLRQHFLALPYELEEAAKIDGASRFHTFARIILPLSGPSIADLGDPLFHVLVERPAASAGDDHRHGQADAAGGPGAAGRALLDRFPRARSRPGSRWRSCPVLIVFIAAQRYIVQSIASSGLKL